MKKAKFIIFISGMVLTVLGFFASNTEDYPFILSIISPSYTAGIKGINSLKSGNDLKPGMPGFKEIAIPLTKRLLNSQTNQPAQPAQCEVVIIKAPTGSGLAFSTSGTKSITKIHAECSNGTPINTNLESLIENVQILKSKNLKWISLSFFCMGVSLSIIGFRIENKGNP